jgi:hypothetical protein
MVMIYIFAYYIIYYIIKQQEHKRGIINNCICCARMLHI